ncbi:MAG: hypothetical protein JW395_2705 [Nitrospira sp.]|nr:hypothetical protein [Nitrospira sp.]
MDRLNLPVRMTAIVSALLGLVKPFQRSNSVQDQRPITIARSVDHGTVGAKIANLSLASLLLGSLEFADSRSLSNIDRSTAANDG